MKNGIHHGINSVIFYLLIIAVASTPCVYAAGTTLLNIREGLHAGYSRLVLECEGAVPETIGPAQQNSFSVQYADLTLNADLNKISGRLHGNVKQIDLRKEKTASAIKLLFATPGARVKSFVMKSKAAPDQKYRLVIDVYPRQKTTAGKKKKVTAASVPSPPAAIVAAPPVTMAGPAPPPMIVTPKSGPPASMVAATAPKAAPKKAAEPTEVLTGQKDAVGQASDWTYSGQASLILRAANNEDQSSKFEEYRDISQPVAGDVSFKAEKDGRLYVKGGAAGVGQDDPAVAVQAGDYGRYDVDLRYDRLVRRYAFDARTLYSGVGSDIMVLNDTLQTNVQNAATSAGQANLLNDAMSVAASGDPDVTRDRLKLGFNLVALDPFSIKIELGHETRQGTRPFAGAFNNTEMVELFEPIDYETTEMKISGAYAENGRLLNFVYHYSQFANNIGTLTFDNPLRASDALGGPATGRFDLAPDNQYHNLAFTGALTKLPWNSQISANLAWGWMMQDDKLLPFTSNTAIAAPALPMDSADAQVNTTLYNLRLTSRPLPFMRVKGNLRYYDYDNRTHRVDFSSGYVETDGFPISTAITTVPTSYTKTQAGLDLGFDVLTRTNLGIGYRFEHTDRENREVKSQDDNTFKASLDTRALEWMDFRASFQRTDRKIGDYNFDVYLISGDNLNELPQMRKYNQADMVRDRYQVQATFYPLQDLALTGSFTYGTDDYNDSPYGLLKDNHYIVSFDTDYAINERATANLFYTYEKFENTQRGSTSGMDWTADGEDRVNTFGGGLTLSLMPKRLDLSLTYSYSDADGNISFASPSGSFADFKAVDDTKKHALNSKLSYHISKNLILSLGYLWEKFDYEDYNKDGFAYVPTDAGGNYQGALLSGTLPQDYDAHVVYTQLTFRYK
jgi:MtrB/PioB family decaheme-associated outer membrane protein